LDNILSNRQHGFRPGLSCDTQLVTTYHEISKSADHGKEIHALVLDFRKAFDMVPHELLIKKLIAYNLDIYLVRWIHNFLTGRMQKVVVKGSASNLTAVTSGVPQGSVIGPKLFLMYINDLPLKLRSKVSLFADDTLVYRTINDGNDQRIFQEDISAIEEWSREWMMPFNVNKTQFIRFGKVKSNTSTIKYFLANSVICEVESIKYLGVTLNKSLTFREHIERKINKAMQTLGFLKRALWNAPRRVKLLGYTSMCRPILEYAAVVWDPYNKNDINSIEMVQRRAIRFIAHLKGRDASITNARMTLQIDTLENRRKNARLSLIHKMLDANYPVLVEFLEKETAQPSTHETRLSTQHLLSSLHANTNTYHYSFLPRTIRDLRNNEDARAPSNPDHN
jgi:hypothetical protein